MPPQKKGNAEEEMREHYKCLPRERERERGSGTVGNRDEQVSRFYFLTEPIVHFSRLS